MTMTPKEIKAEQERIMRESGMTREEIIALLKKELGREILVNRDEYVNKAPATKEELDWLRKG